MQDLDFLIDHEREKINAFGKRFKVKKYDEVPATQGINDESQDEESRIKQRKEEFK